MADSDMRKDNTPKLRIGFVLAQKFTLAAFANFIDVIRLAADEGDRSRPIDCEWSVLGEKDEAIESSCGLKVLASGPLESPGDFDYIVVVGGLLREKRRISSNVNAFLNYAAKASVPIVGLCTGSFIMARAGLLDGYQVCISWFHIDEFELEFPNLKADASRMFVIDRDRLTCAGGIGSAHLAGHLVEKHVSRGRALKAFRIMIEEASLQSDAWQPEEVATRPSKDLLVKKAMRQIEQNIGARMSLDTLAKSLGISGRQLQRRFVNDIGISAQEYRRTIQLARAVWLVKHSNQTMTDIALECGFSDSAHFTRIYKEQFNTLPSKDRQQSHSSAS